jgi:hypothetical protein
LGEAHGKIRKADIRMPCSTIQDGLTADFRGGSKQNNAKLESELRQFGQS